MIEIKNLSHSFGPLKIYDDISFTLEGPFLSYLLGKSGTGKSVLLRLLSKKLIPTSGILKVSEIPALVFQQPILIDSLNVYENLRIIAKDRIEEFLDRLKIGREVLSRNPSELSFGERKKLLIVRALLTNPKLILFDEPTTGLDRVTARELSQLFLELHETYKISMLIVSHDIDCAINYSKNILFLNDRKIIFNGNSEDLKKSDTPIIKDFLCLV